MSDLSRSDQSERTRERLLAAGLELLRGESTERLFERLDAKRLSQQVGVTTGAFYHHFEDMDGFVLSLLAFALEREANPPFGAAVEAFEATTAAGGSFGEGLIAGGEATLRHQESNATFGLELMAWTRCHRDPQLSARLNRMYGLVQGEMTSYFETMLSALGRSMRPPYVTADLTTAFIALQEGLTIRRGVQADSVPPTLLGQLLIPIILMMTREADDDSDAATWLNQHGPAFER